MGFHLAAHKNSIFLLQTVVPENVETPPPSTNDKHDQADECKQPSPAPAEPEEPPAPCPTAQNPPTPCPVAPNPPTPAQCEQKNGSDEAATVPSNDLPAPEHEFSGALPPTPNSDASSNTDVRCEPTPTYIPPAAQPTTECVATQPAVETNSQSKNDEPPRYSEQAPATVEDDRSFRKVTSYYGNQATVPDKSDKSNDNVDKYRLDKARDKPVVDPNTRMYNQTNLGGVNNAVAFTPFSAVSAPPAPPSTLPTGKAVNLSDGRPFTGLPPVTSQSFGNYEMPFQRQFPSDYSEEKYLKSKRLKSTSPVKSSSNTRDRDAMEKYKNSGSTGNAICEPIRKLHPERDDRYANKETNLEQKVRKIADEEQQKYKERSRVKSPIAAIGSIGSKERKVNKSPSTYPSAMDAMNEYAAAKHMEEMKYKRRSEFEEHIMMPVSAANMDLASQHFASATSHLSKQSLPSPHERSMGVYTPDSTTNSVHSVHGYGHQYDMDGSHLNMESPSSISSNDMNSGNLSSNEPVVRPPSSTLSMHEMYMNQQQHATMFALQQLQQTHSMHPFPQLQVAAAAAVAAQSVSSHSKSQNSRKNSSSINHHSHHHHRNKSTGGHHQHSSATLNSSSSSNTNSPLHRSTPSAVGNPHSPVGAYNSSSPSNSNANNSSTSPMGSQHRSTPPAVNHQSQSRHHQIYAPPPHPSHHPVMTQSGFLGMSQMAPVSYPVPVTTVIQPRMTATEPQQRLGSSPCSTSVSSFYMPPHMQSTVTGCSTPSPGATSGSGCSSARLQSAQAAAGGVNPCSLTKLQQLTNGLDMLPPGHCGGTMTPSSPINLTPPPPGVSHPGNMNTPPVAHQVLQQNYNKLLSNLGAASSAAVCTTSSSVVSPSAPTSASGAGSGSSSVPSSSASSSVSSNRSSSRGATNSHHHLHHTSAANSSSNAAAAAAAVASSRSSMSSANVINPMMRYGGAPYGYQMAGQPGAGAQTLSYITNGAAGFQPQIPVRMGVMNVAAQNQYGQDPTQNAMYSPYYGSYLR